MHYAPHQKGGCINTSKSNIKTHLIPENLKPKSLLQAKINTRSYSEGKKKHTQGCTKMISQVVY